MIFIFFFASVIFIFFCISDLQQPRREVVSGNKIEEERVEEDSILVDTRLSEGLGEVLEEGGVAKEGH